MSKVGGVIRIVIGVIIVYLLMLVVMPFISDLASTANTTMAASSNLSNYPGAASGVLAAPWLLWWSPAVIGMTAIVIWLKAK